MFSFQLQIMLRRLGLSARQRPRLRIRRCSPPIPPPVPITKTIGNFVWLFGCLIDFRSNLRCIDRKRICACLCVFITIDLEFRFGFDGIGLMEWSELIEPSLNVMFQNPSFTAIFGSALCQTRRFGAEWIDRLGFLPLFWPPIFVWMITDEPLSTVRSDFGWLSSLAVKLTDGSSRMDYQFALFAVTVCHCWHSAFRRRDIDGVIRSLNSFASYRTWRFIAVTAH